MNLLGAKVEPVDAGARTLKEAVSAAIRDWVATVADTHYIIGSAVGPAPFPALVRDLQRVIGDEARSQAIEAEGVVPARVIACVGGGSNAIGTFYGFLDDPTELIGVEAAGEGIESGRHGASLSAGSTGVLHGAMSAVLADEQGQILEAHSVSAGLDYPGVGPEHAHLRDTGRARYVAVTDDDAVRAFRELARLEGIIPALEPATPSPGSSPTTRRSDGYDVLCLSGRGDKDMEEATAKLAELNGPGGPRRQVSRAAMPEGTKVAGAERIASAFAAARDEGRAALMPYLMGGFPDAAGGGRGRRGLRGRRRRPDRARHPVLGPARRRAGDPRRRDGGARRRSHRRLGPRGLLRGRGASPRRGDGLLEHDPRRGRGGGLRRARIAEAGAAGAIVPDLPLEEAGDDPRRPRSPGPRPGPARRADDAARAPARDLRGRRGLRLPGLDGRGHRRARGAAARADRT